MKRFLTLVLCAVLVLGMIPASIISALAQGKGVAKNETTNHSLENAPNQYIPETITVDGKTDDLGWKEWITVDSASGVWDTEEVAEAQKANSYEYSIRRDHEYLYAAVVFGDSELHDFNIYFSADSGVNVTTVSFVAENKTVGANEIKCVTVGGVVEFSYDLGEAADAETLTYYVSAKYSNNLLYYPAIYPDVNTYVKPSTAEEWNSTVSIKKEEIEFIPSYVNIDGRFTEPYNIQLTNFHQGLIEKSNINDYHNGEYTLLGFNGVKYSEYYYSGSGTDVTLALDPITTTGNEFLREENNLPVRFKTDIRADANAVYGAAYVLIKNYDKNATNKGFYFRVFITNGNDKYTFRIYYQANNDDPLNYALIKNGKVIKTRNATDADKKFDANTSAALKIQDTKLCRLEFKIANSDLGLDANSDISISAMAQYHTDYASLTAYTPADSDGEYAVTTGNNAYTYNKNDRAHTGLSNEITVNGELEISAFFALRGYDGRVNGTKCHDNFTSGNLGMGQVEQYAVAINADYEYIYGSALVEMRDDEWTASDGTGKQEEFSLWIKNDYANGTTGGYTHAIKFYIDQSGNTYARLVVVEGNTYESVLGEDCAEDILKEVQAVIKPVSELREGYDKDDKRYAVEFKIPRYVFDLDYDNIVKDAGASVSGDEKNKDIYAIVYYVSVTSNSGSTSGVYGPVCGTATMGFNPSGDWGSYPSAVNYDAISPQVVADSVFSEELWANTEFTHVDYSNSAVDSDTNRALEYDFKLYRGNEYLYGAAVVNDDDENTQFALWLKAEDDSIWRFVCRDNNVVAYKFGDNISNSVTNGYTNDLNKKFLKYNVSRLNGKTYFEFTLDYDKLSIDKDTDFECFVAAEFATADDAEKCMLYPTAAKLIGYKAAYENINGVWDDTLKSNAIGNIEKLAHIAPEIINIDGELNDNGWDPNGWTEVSANANGTVQSGYTDVYTTEHEDNKPFTYKYQIRHDGEYLYVGAIFYMENDYTTHDSTAETRGGTKPSFRIWINPKDENGKVNETFQYLYDVAAISGTQKFILPTNVGDAEFDFTNSKIIYAAGEDDLTYIGADGNVTKVKSNGTISYPDMVLRAAENIEPHYPNGGRERPVTNEKLVYDMIYGDTVFYGYTDIVQENENCGTTGEDWYAVVDNESYTIGHDHAVICEGTDKSISSVTGNASDVGNKQNAIIEFKVKISEFDPNGNGFEYSLSGAIQGYYSKDSTSVNAQKEGEKLKSYEYTLHHPEKYNAPGSAYNYYGLNFPYWCWYNGIDFDDVKDEAKLRNNCTPVVTLGAKICENYIAPDNQEETGAIRFGARYEEKYIRYLAGMDDADYWDVSDMGIVIFPADYLKDELTLETEGAVNYPADNIVKWKNDTSDGWSNFADYENFVFYITLWGVDSEDYKDMNFAFRGYMTFYEGNYDGGYIGGYGDKFDFYSETIIRSFNEVKNVNDKLSEGGQTDESKPVLPDGDYGESQPPVEDQTSKNS